MILKLDSHLLDNDVTPPANNWVSSCNYGREFIAFCCVFRTKRPQLLMKITWMCYLLSENQGFRLYKLQLSGVSRNCARNCRRAYLFLILSRGSIKTAQSRKAIKPSICSTFRPFNDHYLIQLHLASSF